MFKAVASGYHAGRSILVRVLGFVVVGTLSSACASEAPETVPSGRVLQQVDYARYPVQPSIDVIVVVNTGPTTAGTALRKDVAKALRERARQLAEGDAPWLRDLWNPLDVRAFVANTADRTLRSPREQPSLTWREENATDDGAEAFGAAAEVALAAASASDARGEGLVATLHEALAAAATPPDSERIIVLVSTEDDASAPPALDSMLRLRDSLVVVLPNRVDGTSCTGVSAPHLEAWAVANGGLVKTPCSDIGLRTSFGDYVPRCLGSSFARAGDGATRCRVRALVPPGTICDPARGWQSPRTATSPLEGELAGMSSCDVIAIDGEDARHCRDKASRYNGRASGWCLPAPTRMCNAPSPRLVGGAAPPWATIEVTCNVDE